MSKILTCENVSLGYDGKLVAENINFSLDRGAYLCIVGENGSGKSTLVKAIVGLKKPVSGQIRFAESFNPKDIGYMPQHTEVQKGFPASALEVVMSGRTNSMGMRPFYTKNDKMTALHNMGFMNVSDIKDRCFTELSGGQQQRVLIARALCASTVLLVLDEPMTGLDPHATAELHKLISDINKTLRTTVIMISHDIHAAVNYSTHILHMGGSTPFFGTTCEYADSAIGKAFLCAWGGEHHEHNHSDN